MGTGRPPAALPFSGRPQAGQGNATEQRPAHQRSDSTAMTPRIGLIPGIISEEMKADVFGTFERLAELGYHGVEGGAVLHGGVAENRRRREALGLEAVALGARREQLDADLLDVRAVIAAGLACGIHWFVVEQDRPHHLTGWQSVTASILNLREMGLA